MKKTAAYLIIVTISLVLFSCTAGKKGMQSTSNIYPLGDSASVKDGSLIYALPLTVFTITVDFEREISIPGPYAKFANDMLGLKDVITSQKETWSVTGIRVMTSEEIDPSEYYVIESNSAIYANALKLKRSGLILDINPSIYRRSSAQPQMQGQDASLPSFRDLGADEYFITQSDTAYRTVKMDTSFVKIPYLVEKKKSLTLEQLAEKAAKALLELRDGKHSILSGEANLFPQSSAGLDELNRMEKEYTELFTGKTASERKTITYTIIPTRESAKKPFTLFRFSQSSGLLPVSSANGTAVVAEIEQAKKTKDITIIPAKLKEGEKTETFDKIYYRLPDVATLRIRMNDQVLFECRKLVDQFGEVLQLPANYIIGN